MRSPITTHVLDTARGAPAEGLAIELHRFDGGAWAPLARGITNADGRIADLLPPGALTAGVYRMIFHTGDYHAGLGLHGFYPRVPVVFEVTAPTEHHHIPLLLSPFGYSTYRGS